MFEALRPWKRSVATGSPLVMAVMVLLTVNTLAVVALLARGRLGTADAITLAAVPWAALAAVVRPDWLMLALIAMPASFLSILQMKRVLLLVSVPLVAMFVTRRRFSLGLGTGLVILIIINVAGRVFQANVSQEAIATNEATMESLTFYILLAMLAFNLAVLGELDGSRLATALVIGVVTTLVVGLAGYGNAWFPGGTAIISKTYLAYLAAGALGVSLARLLMPETGGGRRLAHVLLAGLFFFLVIASDVRATWVAAVITFVLLAFRLRRRGVVLILLGVIVIALFSTTVREQISRNESGNIVAELSSGDITTGRWKLWSDLWERGQDALPWGNGFGYIWSLSSQELLGAPGQFQSDVSGHVPPHDDFIYLFVEFGIAGVLLLLFFFVRLFRAQSLLVESEDPMFRQSGWLLLGVLVTGLIAASVDSVILVRPVAEKFFPVAGFILGLAQVERARLREHAISEPSPAMAVPATPVP